MRLAMTEKKIFPSTFNRAMPLNWLMFWESFSLGMKMVTALFHSDGMAWAFQTTLIILKSSFKSPGQLLYTLYGMPLGPGADAALARSITCLTSDHLGGDVSNGVDGSGGWGTYPGGLSGTSLRLSLS